MTFTWKRWLKSVGGKRRATAPVRRPRLGIESMEDRIVPVAGLGAISSNLPSAFDTLQTGALNAQTLQTGLPVVNTALSNTAGGLQFLTALSATLTSEFAAGNTLADVKGALANTFGISASAISVLDQNGALVDTDAKVTAATRVEFTLTNVGKTVTASVPFGFGPSLDGLGFSIGAGSAVNVSLGYTLPVLKFGIEGGGAGTSFYVDLSSTNDLQFTVTATPTNLSPTAQLGFLTVGATNNGGTGLNATFQVDLVGNNRVQPSQFAGLDAQGKLSGSANLNLHLKAQVAAASINPEVEADLVVNWPFAANTNPEVPAAQFGGTGPTVAFNNVTLKTSSLLGGLVTPYLNEVGKALKPVTDVADALLTTVPGLPFDITYLDLFEFATKLPASGDTGAALDALLELFDNDPSELKLVLTKIQDFGKLVQAAREAATGTLMFGSFNLGDVRGTAAGQLTVPPNSGTAPTDAQIGNFASTLEDFNNDDQGTFQSEFKLPILDDPTAVFSLLLGKGDVELMSFELGATPQVASGGYTFATVVGFVPVSFKIEGSLAVDIGVRVGYDSNGFAKYQAGNFASPAALLDGFYVHDSTHVSLVPSVSIAGSAGLTDTFIVDLVRQYTGFTIPSELLSFLPQVIFNLTAVADVTGNLTLSIAEPANTPQDDKVRFSEIGAAGIENALAVSGGATFGAEGYFEYGIKIDLPGRDVTKKVGGGLGKLLTYITEFVIPDPFTYPDPFPGRIDLFEVTPRIELFSFGPGGGTSSTGETAVAPPIPTVDIEGGTFNAGTGNWEVAEGAQATLVGGATNVPAGRLTYSWRQLPNGIDAATATFLNADPAALSAAQSGRAGLKLPVFSLTDHPGASPPLTLVSTDDRYRFELTVTDTQTGLSGRTTFSVVGREVNPTVNSPFPTIAGVGTSRVAVRGRPFEYRATFSDPGPSAAFSTNWDFGDPGSAGNVLAGVATTFGRPTTAFHTYAAAGMYTVTTTVRDGFPDAPAAPVQGRGSAAGAVAVVPAALLPDQANTSKTALYVGGTGASETITLRVNPANNKIIVIMPDFVGEFDRPTGRIYVNGYDGNDTVLFDFSGGEFIPADGAVIDGGAGTNRYQAVGGSFTFVSAAFALSTATGRYDTGAVDYDGATVDFYNTQGITDLTGAEQFSFTGNSDADHFTIRNGLLVGATVTSQLLSGPSGERGDVVFANKASVLVAGGRGADTFVLDNPNPAAGLTELDLLGHGFGTADNAADAFDIRAFAVDVFADGAGGGDTYTVQLGGATGRVIVFDTGSSASGFDTTTVLGTASGDAISVRKDEVRLGGQSVVFDFDVESLTVDGRNGNDVVTIDNADGLILSTVVSVVGGGGVNTLTVQGSPGFTIARASIDVIGPRLGRLVYDPNGTVPFPTDDGGTDAEVITFADIDVLNDVKPATRLDIRVQSGVSNTIGIANGQTVGGAATVAVTGSLPVIQVARKTTAGVSALGGADTFDVDFTAGATDLTRLDLYGHAVPGAAGVGADDNATDTFRVRATGVPVAAYGQGGVDTFELFPGPGVTSANVTLDGGAGIDTVSYSAFASARAVALTGLGATDGFAGTEASGVFTNVNVLAGGASAGDSLTGLDAAATWLLDPSGETYTSGGRTLTFSAFETLTGGAVVDAFNVRAVPAARTLNGRGGDDVFIVSSDAPGTAGNLLGITSTVTIDAGPGVGNRLTVSNLGGAATATAVLTDHDLTGFAPAAIAYAATGGSFTAAGGFGIVVRGSDAGADGLNVRSTLAGSTTLVEGNGGADTITVASDAPSTAGNLTGIAGALTVDGGAGADALVASDFGDAAAGANAAARITATQLIGLAGPGDAQLVTYLSFTTLTVRGSNVSGDGFTVVSPDAVLTLTTEGGADTVRVVSLTRTADVNTGAGDDAVTVANLANSLGDVQAALSVDGGSGANDRLTADDSGTAAGQVYTLSDTTLTRTGAANVTYANIDRMTVFGGAGANTYDVTATGATVSTLVSDGAGGSLFTIQGDGLQAANTFRGNGGAEQFVLNAGLGFSGTALRISGGADRDDLNVNARVGNDVVTIRVTATTGDGTLAGLGLTADFDTLERIDLDGRDGRNSLNWIDDTNQVFGTALAPETGLVVRPLGAASGDVRIGLAETQYPTVAFVNVGGDFTVSGDGDGSGDKDVVTVLAASTPGLQSNFGELVTPNGVDAIDVTDRRVTITNTAAGVLRSVALADAGSSPTVSTLYVRGGAEGRPFGDNVTATPSARLNLLLDGMDPTSGRPGDNLKVSWVGSRSLVKSRDPLKGPDHARFVQDSDGASVGFQRFEKVYDTQIALTGTGPGTETQVVISDPTTGKPRYAVKTPFPGFFGGLSVASADVTGDGVADVIVGAGNGGGPVVVVYDGIEGFEVARYAAYEESFRGGVVVSAADVDGDGFADVVTGTGVTGGPRVIVISGKDQSVLQNYFAYESTFRDGVQVAAGDTNGDGFADILTGTGRGGAPRVVLFDGVTRAVRADFFAFDSRSRFGVNVALGDLDGDFISDLIVGDGSATEPHVRAYRGKDALLLADFMVNDPFAPSAIPVIDRESGVRVGATDLDGDGIADILVGKGPGTRPIFRGYKIATVDPVTKKVSVGLTESHRETMFDPNVYGWGIEVGGSD